MFVKKGDKVKILSGKDKGKKGDVLKVIPTQSKVIVSGVNVVKKHVKKSQQFPQGGIIEFEKPIASSRVQIIDPKTGKPTRVGKLISKDGKNMRVSKVSNAKL